MSFNSASSSNSAASVWYQEKMESILNTTVDRATTYLNGSIADALLSADLVDDIEAWKQCEVTQTRLKQRMTRFQELWRKNMETLLQSDHRGKSNNNNNAVNNNDNETSSLGMMSKISDEESVFEWTKNDPQLKILMDRVQSNLRSSKILQSVSALQHQQDSTKNKGSTIQNATKQELRSFPPDLFVSKIHQVDQIKWSRRRFDLKKNEVATSQSQRRTGIDFPLDKWMAIEAKKIESGELEVANNGMLASLLRYDADDDDSADIDSYMADHIDAFDLDGIGKVDDWLQEFHQKHFVVTNDQRSGKETANNEMKNKKSSKKREASDDAAENRSDEMPAKHLRILHLNGIVWGPGHTKAILEDSVRCSLSGHDAPAFSAGHCFVKFPGETSSSSTASSDLLERKSNDEEIFARFDLLLPYLNQTRERQKMQ